MKTRSKLMAALAMLLVSTIMMTTASFAWFTISTAPEISNIDTTVTANGNLEIALDTTGKKPAESTTSDSKADYTDNGLWGNLVDLNGNSEIGKVSLKPVQYTEATATKANPFDYPEYGLDGRIKSLADCTATTTAAGITCYTDGAGDEIAFRVDFWLRSNVAGNISLSGPADRGTGEQAGLGSTLDNALVSVVFHDGTKSTEATLASGNLTASNITSLTANTEKLISMYVFMDGDEVTNASLDNATKAVNLNVQFAHSVKLTPMNVTASGNGRSGAAAPEATDPTEPTT